MILMLISFVPSKYLEISLEAILQLMRVWSSKLFKINPVSLGSFLQRSSIFEIYNETDIKDKVAFLILIVIVIAHYDSFLITSKN